MTATMPLPQPHYVTAMAQPAAIQTVNPIVVVQPHASSTRDRRKNSLYGLGITEVVLGSLSILFGIISMAIGHGEVNKSSRSGYYYDYASTALGLTYASQGIWGGLLILITGVLGMRVKSNPTRCLYIANITMATITATCVCAVFILSLFAALFSMFSGALIVLHSLITLFTFVSFILTIIHAGYGCCGVCRRSGSIQQTVLLPQQNMYPTHQAQYVQGPNGQFLMVANQASLMMNVAQPLMTQVAVQPYLQSASPAYSSHGQQQNVQSPPSYYQPSAQVKQAGL